MAPFPENKIFAIIFGFFRIFILPSVNLCRVPSCHWGNPLPSAQHAALGKEAFAVKGYADSSLPSAALGKARVSRSEWVKIFLKNIKLLGFIL